MLPENMIRLSPIQAPLAIQAVDKVSNETNITTEKSKDTVSIETSK
jgi:hypothetical protein